jgi:signal transduction histidine kinase/DNA-binding response OmpR family regulator
MADQNPGAPPVGDQTEVIRKALGSVLAQAQLASGARAVGLALPAPAPGSWIIGQAVGTGLTAGSVLVADTVPGLRVVPLPAPGEGLAAPAGALLVLRGLASIEPGSALAACLLALAALVQVAQTILPGPARTGTTGPLVVPGGTATAAGATQTEADSRFLQILLTHVPAGIVAFSVPDFRVRQVSPFYLQLLDEPFRSGTVPLVGRRLSQFIPQAAESGIQGIFEAVTRSGQPYTISEFEYRGFSRGVTYWNWSLVPLRDAPGGPVVGLLLLTVEMTQQVVARQRLAEALDAARRQAAELDTVIQQMVEGVAITDRQGSVTTINPAGVALLGRGVIPLEPGVDYAERYGLFHLDGSPAHADELPLERARLGATIMGQDLLVRHPDGQERIIAVSAAPLYDGENRPNGAVGVFHDVTRIRELDRLKDEFLAIVSHELRTPLAAILGYSDLILRGVHGPLTDKQTQTQRAIRSNANRLLTLVNDLLDVSKLEAGGITLQPALVPLSTAVPKAVGWVQGLAAERGIGVNYEVSAELPPVWADEERLQQVLTNLLSNAVKFTPSGGTVLVRARASALPPGAPPDTPESAMAPREATSILLTVQDTGVGMDADSLNRIWDRFYQADSTSSRRFGGTGLGLSIVKNIVELHGGRVWASSAGPERGSTFFVRLPAGAPKALPTHDEKEAELLRAAEAGTPILVIEDNADLRAIMRTMLEGQGYMVAEAADGARGLDLARKVRPAAILLDVVLPQATGWDVLQRLKADPLTMQIPVVVISILEQQRMGMLLGATTYLVKPFDSGKLAHTLRGLVPGVGLPRLLIVDDEPALRTSLAELLQEEGFAVETAEDGLAALERLGAGPPDVLLLDLMMPRLDGFAVLEWLRAHPDPAIYGLPVVLITAKDLTPAEREALAAATQALIPKAGLSVGELLRAIRETLERLHVTPPHDDPAGPPRGRS